MNIHVRRWLLPAFSFLFFQPLFAQDDIIRIVKPDGTAITMAGEARKVMPLAPMKSKILSMQRPCYPDRNPPREEMKTRSISLSLRGSQMTNPPL
ncbi:MAG: hypothetical protein A4E65_03097 [Syntrophorhabdus sp. PtaU1.Bin153]|nr:MAG: hypothetical protein A4E65_03097 [Syntrophorhabdus sp. PtaU1.Bin153]